jgi:sensor histidine kinase YesM
MGILLKIFASSTFILFGLFAFAGDTIYISNIQSSLKLLDAEGVQFHTSNANEKLWQVQQSARWINFDSTLQDDNLKSFWLRFTIANNTNKGQAIIYKNEFTDSTTLFIQTADTTIIVRSGEYINGNKLQFSYDISANQFVLAANQSAVVYIQLYNEQNHLRLQFCKLLTPEEYNRLLSQTVIRQRADAEYHTAVLGALLFSVVFMSLISIWFREKSFLFYILFVLGAFIYLITKSAPYSFLNIQVQQLSPYIFKLSEGFQYLFYASYITFGIHLLNVNRYQKLYIFSKTIILLFLLYAVSIVIYQFVFNIVLLPVSIFLPARIISYTLSGIALIWTIIAVTSPLKKLYLTGCFLFVLFTLLSALSNLHLASDLKPFYFMPPIFYFKTGVLLEALVFAVALGYKMFLVEKDKRNNYQAYIQQLEVNERLIKNMNTQLEATVTERTIELEKQKENQLRAGYEQKMINLEMQALRSQMNPHFIFNALNSIRYQIQSQQYKMASDYLMKFSKLLRLTLENSRKETISLEEELAHTKLYLEIEGQRFGEQFEYCIDIDKNIDCQEIEIPPTLLQPFTENAVKHGLMHSTKAKKQITIRVYTFEDYYTISIEDNGIGRAASQIRKQQSGLQHNSLGMQITQERIDLFTKNFGHLLNLEIEDLQANDEPAGTRVKITYKTNFYVQSSISG